MRHLPATLLQSTLQNSAPPNVHCSFRLTETGSKFSLQEGENAHNISVDKREEETILFLYGRVKYE